MLGRLKALGHTGPRGELAYTADPVVPAMTRPVAFLWSSQAEAVSCLPPCVRQVGLAFLTPLWGTQAFTPLSCCEHWQQRPVSSSALHSPHHCWLPAWITVPSHKRLGHLTHI